MASAATLTILFDHEADLRRIGTDIESAHGLEGMQYVWKTLCSLKGRGPAAELTRIWDGIGRWQK